MEVFCDKCGEKFKKKFNLNRHVKNTCEKNSELNKKIKFRSTNKSDDVKNIFPLHVQSQKIKLRTANKSENKENIKKIAGACPSVELIDKILDIDEKPGNSNNEANPTMVEMFECLLESQRKMQDNFTERQKQMLETQHHLQDKIDKLEKELKNKDNQTNITNNVNITINNYFNRNLDIHKLASISKGEKWADNYILYTIHREGKYFEAIMDFLIKPDPNNSPIRKDKDGNIVLYRSATSIEKDNNYQLIEKDTKNIISLAYMKTFDKYTNHQDIWFDALNESQFVKKYEDDKNTEKMDLHQSKLNNLHNKILDGDCDCPSLKDLHINLEKINKYKIAPQSRKILDSMLNDMIVI